MSSLRTNWAGVFPAFVTPFANGEFDEVAYRAHLRTLLDDKVDGLVVTSSAGEWYTMSDKERIRAWEIARDVAGKVPVIAGTSTVGTREAVKLAREASEVGVDGCMVLPPGGCFAAPHEVVGFFNSVADVGLPVMVYSNVPRTGVSLDAKLMKKIAEHEKVVAFKDSSRDLYGASEIIYAISDKLAVFTGLEPYYSAVYNRGAVGTISMLSNFSPVMVAYHRALKAGDAAAIKECERTVDNFYHLMAAVGAPGLVFLKAAMNLAGRSGGDVRLPHLPANAAVTQAIREGLTKIGML